jgi:hypothetical protein
MARILYWNVNNFSNEKIALNTLKRGRDDMEANSGPRGPAHRQMIRSTLRPIDPTTGITVVLDFIVVVEIYQRQGPANEGQLVGGNAETGCCALYDYIQAQIPGNWAMVPPVVSGQNGRREGIAVFYNRNNWYFLGPDTWPAAYPAAYQVRIPNRIIPGGYAYDPNPAVARPERRSAGQWQFQANVPPGFFGPAPLVQFPGAAFRKPWLTAFSPVGTPNTLVRIMSLHTTPNDLAGAYADQATTNLAQVHDMTARAPDAANQTDVIVGDFNVDNLNAANFLAGGPFASLIGVGPGAIATPYTPLVRPPAGLNVIYNSYYHTHGKSGSNIPGQAPARIADDNPIPPPNVLEEGHYPGLEYSDLSIDNALVRYQGGAAAPGAGPRTTILGRARQQPYFAPAGPPVPMPLLGTYQSTVYMNETIGVLVNNFNANAMLAALNDINEHFRDWDNYGLVYSVSDHFAVIFDV